MFTEKKRPPSSLALQADIATSQPPIKKRSKNKKTPPKASANLSPISTNAELPPSAPPPSVEIIVIDDEDSENEIKAGGEEETTATSSSSSSVVEITEEAPEVKEDESSTVVPTTSTGTSSSQERSIFFSSPPSSPTTSTDIAAAIVTMPIHTHTSCSSTFILEDLYQILNAAFDTKHCGEVNFVAVLSAAQDKCPSLSEATFLNLIAQAQTMNKIFLYEQIVYQI